MNLEKLSAREREAMTHLSVHKRGLTTEQLGLLMFGPLSLGKHVTKAKGLIWNLRKKGMPIEVGNWEANGAARYRLMDEGGE